MYLKRWALYNNKILFYKCKELYSNKNLDKDNFIFPL